METTSKKEFTLPKKWCIKVNQSNDKLWGWFNSNSQTGEYNYQTWSKGYLHYPAFKGYSMCHQSGRIQFGYKEITFEQFEKYVLMEKEIIGYKLKDSALKYAVAAAKIANVDQLLSAHGEKQCNFTYNSVCKTKLEEAGVLDLWFDEVYKQDDKITSYSVGDYVYCKKDFTMDNDPEDVRYKSGRVYICENKNCLTDEVGNASHSMHVDGRYKNGNFHDHFRVPTPKEIKTFRKTSKTLRIGSGDIQVVISERTIKVNNIDVSVVELEKAIALFEVPKTLKIGNWESKIDTIRIGCSTFTEKELHSVLHVHKNFYSSVIEEEEEEELPF